MGGCFEIDNSFGVDPGGWADVYPPVKCDSVIITNGGSSILRLRRNKAIASSEIEIPAGGWKMVAAPSNYVEGEASQPRFRPADVAFSLKPDSGTGPVTLEYA